MSTKKQFRLGGELSLVFCSEINSYRSVSRFAVRRGDGGPPPMATKMLPKSTRKALGRKGLKNGKYWYGYQGATSGTFRKEKCRFFALSSGFSKFFQPVRGVTQGSDGRKGCEISQYGRKSRIWHRILAIKPGSQI